MCGISGIINQNDSEVQFDQIKKINDLIKHRGPDSEGFFLEKNFAFGHRRLAILDLSTDGYQPMHYIDRYTITYNGEVYNYLEVKEQLEQCGYKFKSNTDTEVILAAYDKWGHNCVKQFNGMWAFAIYDKKEQKIFCSRDRFGIKPFYYTEKDGKFIFGSEIKQLLEFHSERYVNQSMLMDYLVIGYENHTKETFFDNIFKLEQSHNLIYDLKSNQYQVLKYYDIEKEVLTFNEGYSIKEYQKQLNSSVELRLRSDVKIGTCLSGGLDSSSIAAIASKKYMEQSNKKFVAIHAKSSQESNDESFFAEQVSKYCNLDLMTVEPSSNEFIKIIDEVIYTQEEPFGGPSIFMQYFVMKKAKDIGCTVMLDGQGGDETLLGYERYYPAYLMNLNFKGFIKGFFNASKNSKLTKNQLIKYFIYFISANIRLKNLKKKNQFIKNEYFNKINKNHLEKNAKSYLDIFALQYMEIFSTQLPHLLRYEDRNSMRHSIEARLPFIDYKVLETALSINDEFKIRKGWTKYVLRKVVEKSLPNSIVWRKNKFGFEAPTKTWLNAVSDQMKESIEGSSILKEISNHILFDGLDEKQKWKFFNIAKWEKIYNVKIK